MKFEKFRRFFGIRESFKDEKMDEILGKIFNKQKLSEDEQVFLNNYDNMPNESPIDHMMLDRHSTYMRITGILDEGTPIICNLVDRNGKIGIPIVSIYSDFNSEESVMTLKNGEKALLKDNFLYNIIYNMKKGEYSLEAHDEYFEKIPVRND